MRQSINKAMRPAVCVILSVISPIAFAQTSQFTYQGKLGDGGLPANGSYSLEFKLFDNATPPGIQHGLTATLSNVTVTDGIFTVILDFGACASCFNGSPRFLEIAVKQTGGSLFTTLAPRQPITSAPLAIRSLNAATADGLSLACVNCVTSSQIQSVAGSQVNGLIPVSSVPAGSTSYVQNQTALSQPANFQISGIGNANTFNATTQYNIGGMRILSNPGTANLFAGSGSGGSNTGTNNSFLGNNAGFNNTTGIRNSFVGSGAGFNTTTGNYNSFFGSSAGGQNTVGSQNSFFGNESGSSNVSGGQNSFFGANVGFSNTTGNSNSFVGVVAGQLNTTGSSNSFFGAGAGGSNVSGSFNSFVGASAGFSTTGNSNTFIGFLSGNNTTTGGGNSFLGNASGASNTTGSNNTLVGQLANVGSGNLSNATAIGAGTVVSTSNTVALGRNLDTVEIPGNLNVAGTLTATFSVPASSITGVLGAGNGGTGLISPGATGNLLRSGGANWISSALQASDIPDLGANYIQNQTAVFQPANFTVGGTGTANIFRAETQYNIGSNRVLFAIGDTLSVGVGAGQNNAGGGNSFFGFFSGQSNGTGSFNSFFGDAAGTNNSSGERNSFFGTSAGQGNAVGNNNTFVGFGANPTTGNLSNATAIGSNATVSQSNSLVLGSIINNNGAVADTSVGIGTTAPLAKLHLSGTGIVRARVNSDSNAGFALALNEQLKWSVATTTGGNFQIYNDAIGQNALGIDTANNNVGIGTTTPQYKLHVVGQNVRVEGGSFPRFSLNFTAGAADEKRWQNYAATGSLQFTALNDAESGETPWLQVNRGSGTAISSVVLPNGNVGIGTTNPLAKLHVQGFVRLNVDNGGINQLCLNGFIISSCSSSIRYKQNINAFNKGLSLIKQLRPVSFNWRSNNQFDFGLVAEEVNQIEPLLTTTNDKGEIEGVKYDRVGVVLVNAVQEQQRQIESLAKLTQAQEKQLESQQKQIDSLKQIVCSMNARADICR